MLPADEIPRLTEVEGPMRDHPQGAHLADLIRAAVLEDDGQIVGYWVLFGTVHAEPLWISEAYRHRPKAARALLATVYTELQRAGVGSVFALIDEETVPHVAEMATSLGLRPMPGAVWAGTIPVDASEGE